MADVARLAGVSHQTVSRVLNHHPYVSTETRQRVLEAVVTLDYRPNEMARNLARRGRFRHAVAIPDGYSPQLPEVKPGSSRSDSGQSHAAGHTHAPSQ